MTSAFKILRGGDRAASGTRLALKPPQPVTGSVDGGWWPRSRVLAAELPSLSDLLAQRLGPVESVSYHLGDWDQAPRRTVVGSRIVRLAGYRSQHSGTVDVISALGRVTLLVVPPAAPAAPAALAAAGDRDNVDGVEALLGRAAADDTTAVQRWEVDGGPTADRRG